MKLNQISLNISRIIITFLILSHVNLFAQCASNATSTSDEDILNVTFGTLNNTSTCASTGGVGSILNEYSNYAFAGFAGGIPNIDRGCTIPFSVQIGTCGGNYSNSIAIYIDWNNDLDFIDAGENVYLSAASTTGPHTETGNITIPLTATLGNCKMRVVNVETTPSSITPCGTYSWGETEDYFVNITNSGGVAPYVSSTVNQLVSGSVSQCAYLQQIICVPVVMGAGCSAGALTQFQLGAGLSTNLLADVNKIHIFYTGTSNIYSATNEFVIGGTIPSGAANTINGSQTLQANATNYFWVTYDMNNSSIIGDLIDGSCSQITISGTNHIPSVTNPAGSGTIVTCPCSFSLGSDVSLCAPFNYTINGPSGFDSYVWSPGGATTQNLTVSSAGTYTCTGTLINGGLVVNGDFSSGNTGFSSNYILGTGGTWGPLSNPGTYSITNNPNSAHSNFYTFGDHSSGSGNMMVCNGSSVANDIAWSQTITVTPNTFYNFSAWVASTENTSSGSEALLQFSINGSLIGPVVNAPLTGGVWSNFFVNWNSGSNTSAIIKIVDQNISGGANDFCLDDINFERICTYSDIITINTASTTTVSVPANMTVCNGYSVAASSYTSSSAGVTYSWTNSNPSIGLAANGSGNTPLFNAINTGTNVVNSIITVTPSIGGCVGTPKSYTITVNPNPTLAATATNSIICLGGSTILNANGASTYTWTGGVTDGVAFSPTVTTTYTVTGASISGCINTAIQTITVSPSLTLTVNSTTICEGSTSLLTANGATSYSWSNGASTQTISVTPTVTTVYTVTGNSSGCTGTNTSTVTVNTSPTITVNNPTTCSGVATILTANGATSYTWSTGATTQTVSVAPISNTIYTVTGTTNGCSGTTTSTVSINTALTVNVNSPTICAGTNTVLTASGATNYTWSTGATSATISVSPTSTTVYTVIGETSGCTGNNSTTVTVNATPTIAVNSASMCSGASITLTANGATSYSWSNGATTQTVNVSPSGTTIYSVTGTTNGCVGNDTTLVTVNVNPTLTVNSATTCAGTPVTLTASGASSYSWSTGASSQTVSVSPNSNTVYTVTGTTNGCIGSNTTTVSINSALSISVNSPTICAGTSTILTASGSATSYTWSTGATTSTISVSPTSTSIYSITGEAGGCIGSSTTSIIVNSIPTITVNNPIVCSGTSATLTANSAATYSWSTGATTQTISVSPTSTSIYTITGTTNGCSASNTSTVTVNVNPTITVNSSSICSGASATLVASGGTTYSWSPSIGLSLTTGSVVVANPNTTIAYSVTGTSNTCSGNQTSTVNVTVVPTLAVNNSTICSGQTSVLTVTPSILGGIFTWSPGNQSTSGISVSPITTSNYSVTYSINSCSVNATTTVLVNAVPTVTVTNISICEGQTGTLNAAPSIIGGTYIWSPLGQTTQSISDAPIINSTYNVLYSLNGCTATATGIINVNPNPALILTTTASTVFPMEDAILTATGIGTYVWSTAETSSVITVNPQNTTTYCATITSTSGCTNTSCIDIIVIDESSLYIPNVFTPNNDGVNEIYYTPSRNIINYNLTIYNRWGQLLFTSNDPLKGWDGSFSGKSVPDGVYVFLLDAKGADGVVYKKSGHITVLH